MAWNREVDYGVSYSALPLQTMVAITIWECGVDTSRALGGTTVSLFNDKNLARRGRIKLRVYPDVTADAAHNTSTPGRANVATELHLAEKALKRLGLDQKKRGAHNSTDSWLNQHTFLEIERLNRVHRTADPSLFIKMPSGSCRVTFGQKAYQDKKARPHFGKTAARLPVDGLAHTGAADPAEAFSTQVERLLSDSAQDAKGRQPTADEREDLRRFIHAPPSRPPSDRDAVLSWTLRYWLQATPEALTPFLRAADWTNPETVEETRRVVDGWTWPSTEGLLELLTPRYTEMAPWIREEAVDRLRAAPLAELKLFLPQLVHSVRFDQKSSPEELTVAAVIVKKAATDLEAATQLYWTARVESESIGGEVFVALLEKWEIELMNHPEVHTAVAQQQELVRKLSLLTDSVKAQKDGRKKVIAMLPTLIEEAGLPDTPLAIPLDPRVRVTGFDTHGGHIFKSAKQPIKLVGLTVDEDDVDGDVDVAGSHVEGVTPTPTPLQAGSTPRSGPGSLGGRSTPNPLPQPTPRPAPAPGYPMMVKIGDDVRQDELVLQLLRLMDVILKRENLDLCLTPYHCIATSPVGGLVEMVSPSIDLEAIIQDYKTKNGVRAYFKHVAPAPDSRYGVSPNVLSTFVKSCAGYCVATYLLGVGDRHLENLMVQPDGRLFHIDFGFILGRDPKVFAPPMKISSQMVEGMGGPTSASYQQFQELCCEAYNILRKHASTFLAILELMSQSSIEVIVEDARNHFVKLEEKFQIGRPDEQAVRYFRDLIQESVSALFPQIVDTAHRLVQALRT